MIERRSTSLRELKARLEHERSRLTAAGYLPAVGELLFRHGETRIEAELRWHAELGERLTGTQATTAQGSRGRGHA